MTPEWGRGRGVNDAYMFLTLTDKIDLLLGKPDPAWRSRFVTRAVQKRFQRLNFSTITRILEAIDTGAETPYAIRSLSGIARPETVSKYLNLCEEFGFVNRTEEDYRREGQKRKIYSLTKDGKQVISVFSKY